MNPYVSCLIVIGCVLIFCTGCTSNDKDSPGSGITPSKTGDQRFPASIWDGPVAELPKELSASISADEDAITHEITVTYNGGGGQHLIRDMQVRFLPDGGQAEVRTLGKNKGDSVTVQGTRKTDRVQAGMSLMDGRSYKIFDRNLTEKGREI
jgi:hypothetical protein